MKYLDKTGLTTVWSKIKSLFVTKSELSSGLNSKANDSDVVHKSGNETITGTKTFSSNIVGNLTGNADSATKATTADSADSVAWNNVTGKPTIPTVNNATLTIQKNDSSVGTFTANASANKTINITVPTKTSELTNNSGFWTPSGGNWNGNANITCNATSNGQEWSFDCNIGNYTGCYWHVWDSKRKYSVLSVHFDDSSVRVEKKIIFI